MRVITREAVNIANLFSVLITTADFLKKKEEDFIALYRSLGVSIQFYEADLTEFYYSLETCVKGFTASP